MTKKGKKRKLQKRTKKRERQKLFRKFPKKWKRRRNIKKERKKHKSDRKKSKEDSIKKGKQKISSCSSSENNTDNLSETLSDKISDTEHSKIIQQQKMEKKQDQNMTITDPKKGKSEKLTLGTKKGEFPENAPKDVLMITRGGQKHIEFSDDDSNAASLGNTGNSDNSEKILPETKIIMTEIYLRPLKRPTVESWQNSGWRKNIYYNNHNDKPKRQRKRGGRKRNTHSNDTNAQNESTQSVETEASDPEKPESVDYSKFPVFDGKPEAGDILAYKILEVSERMCPELSDWKEAKVLAFSEQTQQIQLEQLNFLVPSQNNSEPPAEEEELEYILEGNSPISEVLWFEMQDVRLVSKNSASTK